MIVTEEEAKTKRCQEGFGPSTEGKAASSIGAAGLYTQPSFCIGSACMAWRWKEAPEIIRDDTQVVDLWKQGKLTLRPVSPLQHDYPLVRDVRRATDAELLRLPNFGRKSLNEVRALLSAKVKIKGRGYCGKAGRP